MPPSRGATPTAEATGALNTLWLEDGKLVGANTDAVGLSRQPRRERSRLGSQARAGGGARRRRRGAGDRLGAASRAASRRSTSSIATPARPTALARLFGESVSSRRRWADVPRLLQRRAHPRQHDDARHGRPAAAQRSISPRLPKDAVVNDIVYVPMETGLARRRARRAASAPPAASACCSTRRCRASSTGSAGGRK